MRCVTKIPADVCATKDSEVHVVTNVSRDITTIPIVCLVTVP